MHSSDEDRFLEIILGNPVNAALLERLSALALPDSWLVSGCLFQTVWNALTGRPPTHGILDYDVFYYDATDLSWDAEDAVIRRCHSATADLGVVVQVRNQARVHLWYPQKYGLLIPPLASSRASIRTFLSTSSCLGIRAARSGVPEVYAPCGFDDLFALVVRPNPMRQWRLGHEEKVGRWRETWPELTVLQWPSGDEP